MPLVDDRTQQLINVLADCVAKCEALRHCAGAAPTPVTGARRSASGPG